MSSMKPHEGTLYEVAKRVNDGPWIRYSSADARDKAQALIDYAAKLHSDRCPIDRVEFSITKVY